VKDLFIDIDGRKVSDYHDLCHQSDLWPNKSPVSHEENSIWFWLEKNHQYNCQLWDEEDKARRINVSDSDIALNKRNIDGYNQKRNDAIEEIDENILDRLKGVKVSESAWFNSETAGSIIDRLSIVSLKVLHMGIQANRADIDVTQKKEAKDKQIALSSKEMIYYFALISFLMAVHRGKDSIAYIDSLKCITIQE